MADSWDSIFKKQINIPEKESERKQSTLDNLTTSSKKQTLDEPINLSFLFDTPLQDNTSTYDTSSDSELGRNNGSQPSQRSFGDEYYSDSHSNRNLDDKLSSTRPKLPEIQWNQAKTHSNAWGNRSSKYSGNPQYNENSAVKPKIISFGGNRALKNMYKRIQSRDQAKNIQNQFSGRSSDTLGFQKLAARQNVTADCLYENPAQFANSRDQKLGIPKLPNKRSTPSMNNQYSNVGIPQGPKSSNLTPVRGISSFQTDLPYQPSNNYGNTMNSPNNINNSGFSSQQAANSQLPRNFSPALSNPIYSARNDPYSGRENESSYGSLRETRQNLHSLQGEIPNEEYPYSRNSNGNSHFCNSRIPINEADYQSRFRSQNSYHQQSSGQQKYTRGFSNYGINPRSFPSSPLPSKNYAAYGFQNHPESNSASPYSKSQYTPSQHSAQYPQQYSYTMNSSRQNNFQQNPSSQFRTPNLESRLTPLQLADQISPMNQIMMRQEESRIMRQVQDNHLSYPEPEMANLPADKDLREALILETFLDIPKSEPVKHEILQFLLTSGPISETVLLRKIKKSGRYMGRVALGLIMFHLIEEFGTDMIQRKFSERTYSYSVSDRFKEIVATAMKNF
ncbi:MAG: hypothetical protein ACTSRK_05865 [Promethearchaeota archaeon]